jgi:hypothetical protein
MTLLAALLLTTTMVTGAAAAGAAPRQDQGLTIVASPNPIIAGDPVLIYGQLSGPDNAGQRIRLYHHLAGSHRGYNLVTSATTDANGVYEFPRAEDVVYTNRSWFVRGPAGTHSDVVREQVAALVTLTSPTDTVYTGQPVDFAGTVTPNHHGEDVVLQEQIGSSNTWRTLKSGPIQGNSAYSISYGWKRAGVRDVRVLFRGDVRNIAGASDPVTVDVQQTQVPDFTIESSQPVAPEGATVTISGTLYMPGTTTPEPDTPVQLWGRIGPGNGFVVLGNTNTDSQGDYSFTEANETYNTVYFAATLPSKGVEARRSARLNQGVQDALTLQASATSVLVGQVVQFTGTVMPDKAGDTIYLEKQGKDGHWHVVEVRQVKHNSTYQFAWKFGAPGQFTFRTRIIADGDNVGARSDPVTVSATLPPTGP